MWRLGRIDNISTFVSPSLLLPIESLVLRLFLQHRIVLEIEEPHGHRRLRDSDGPHKPPTLLRLLSHMHPSSAVWMTQRRYT